MSCLVPGRVIVAPRKDADMAIGAIREHTRERVDVAWSIEDVLLHYHLREGVTDLRRRLGPLPFVARVPEGKEHALAATFSRVPDIRCSLPDFYIRPTALQLKPSRKAIDQALDACGLLPAEPGFGAYVRIAVLDTGVEPGVLVNPNALQLQQFDAEMPLNGLKSPTPEDAVGHGTLVAYILNRISPAARLLSVRVMNNTGTIGSLLAGIYLAEAEFRPDVFNLSLSFSCDADVCNVCGTPHRPAINAAQVRLLFQNIEKGRTGGASSPVFIAASGNNRDALSLPAMFPRFVAVGAFDAARGKEADYSRYRSVPRDRYVLAPGGSSGQSFATVGTATGTWERNNELFGTSFSTAFVSGTVARYIALARGQYPKGRVREGRVTDVFQLAVDCLARTCDRSWSEYDPDRHGLGLLRWDASTAGAVAASDAIRRSTIGGQLFIVVDTTGSMDGKISSVAEHVAALSSRVGADTVLRLVLFGDHDDSYTVYVERVSESPAEIAEAIRYSPRTHGGDTPEALEDALHFVNAEIVAMRLTDVEVVVFTDAPPHSPGDCPNGYDFAAEVSSLNSSGARLTIVGCPTPPSGLPAGVSICSLEEHKWEE